MTLEINSRNIESKLSQLRCLHLIRDCLKHSLVKVEGKIDDLADELATEATQYIAGSDTIKPDK